VRRSKNSNAFQDLFQKHSGENKTVKGGECSTGYSRKNHPRSKYDGEKGSGYKTSGALTDSPATTQRTTKKFMVVKCGVGKESVDKDASGGEGVASNSKAAGKRRKQFTRVTSRSHKFCKNCGQHARERGMCDKTQGKKNAVH